MQIGVMFLIDDSQLVDNYLCWEAYPFPRVASIKPQLVSPVVNLNIKR